jgi:hypothetical protein
LVRAGADSTLTCFHYFRHGFRDAARNTQLDREIALTLGGWITGSSQSEAADAYGAGYRPQLLNEAIYNIAYDKLDLSHIYGIV